MYSKLLPIPLIWLFFLPVFARAEVPVPDFAVDRIGSPQVIVAPDRRDWTYALGEPVRFTVSVLYDGQPLEGVVIRYALGPEKFEAAPVEVTLADGVLELEGGTLSTPGFLRCAVSTEIDGRTYQGLATAGFEPAAIAPTQDEPEDFDAFWADHLAALEDLPLELEKTLLPDACTAAVNVFHVSYQTWGSGGATRFYGILTEPSAPGRYPAVLRVPGAGVRPYGGEIEWAAEGLIVLQLGIHGIPVNLEPRLYAELRRGALRDYPTFNLDLPDDYYYRRVYLGCVRGNDVLTAHPAWDGETLVVAGGSQGGQLSIVTTALDPRVTGTVANYPAYCDVTGYLHDRAGGWPHMFARETHRTPEKIATTAYYDAVNFARRLRVPGSFAWGYNDVTCPPTSMFAAYNVITAPKELHLQLEMGHPSTDEFSRRFTDRLLKMTGLD